MDDSGSNIFQPGGCQPIVLVNITSVLTNQWTWLYEALLEVSMTKIQLWIRVCADNWAAKSAIKASNDFSENCMKMKINWTKRGRVSQTFPLDPPKLPCKRYAYLSRKTAKGSKQILLSPITSQDHFRVHSYFAWRRIQFNLSSSRFYQIRHEVQ